MAATQHFGGDLIAGKNRFGQGGGGVLGSQVPSAGDQGPGLIYSSLDGAPDMTKEYWFLVTTPPSSGTLFVDWDSSFLLTGAPNGAYTIVGTLYENYVAVGSVTHTVNIGPVDLMGSALALLSASAGLSLLKTLQGSAAGAGGASGSLGVGTVLGGAAPGRAQASAAMQVQVRLAGASLGVGGAGGTLSSASSSGLQGGATVMAGAGGQLAVSIPLFGQALGRGGAQAELLSAAVNLSGQAAAAAGAAGTLWINVPLQGQAQQLAGASGGLVVTVLLGGVGEGRASAGGRFTEEVLLSAAGGGRAVATANLLLTDSSLISSKALRVSNPVRNWRVFNDRNKRRIQ
ncbi:MAG: hypothetical protein KIT35_22045 [Piscinibacter sp.]|uniref:hypothetical protein n=1 Tax=Piscinibacter sp. TaxID=1903157 RepID=UPI00258D466B|nr:hypothetical protein [Piscinibacter sp.]MCW5666523.1 hypothetical protein [Piscinibacter sp.]